MSKANQTGVPADQTDDGWRARGLKILERHSRSRLADEVWESFHRILDRARYPMSIAPYNSPLACIQCR